jgi:alkylation response protein AidB-like acyl-CoA dehydrogenase
MPIAISDEHEEQRATVRRWLESHCPPSVPRTLLDAEGEELQPIWKELAATGWLGIHLPEERGGEGFGLLELAVVLEETGRALVPGPLLPTVAASALISEAAKSEQAALLLPGLIDGSTPAALSFGDACLEVVEEGADGSIVVSGTLSPLLGASTAAVVLAPARTKDGSVIWSLLEVSELGEQVTISPLTSLDPTRRLGTVEISSMTVGPERQLEALTTRRAREVLVALLAAEHAGGARWCLETATEYAKVRVQFGRPIGQFQAVKHRLADMAIRVEQMTAVAWDAAMAVGTGSSEDAELVAATAGAISLDGYALGAKECIQLLGGLGFTWEHDAHLHLRRAMADRQLMGEPDRYGQDVAEAAGRGTRRTLAADLPADADVTRAALTPLIAEIAAVEGVERRRKIVDAGLVMPHWPAPYGRDAGAIEQVVIDELLGAAGVQRPHIGIGAWALPPIIASGTPLQRERWVDATLMGDLNWCQLFSEPGAGSDLASLSTRAERTDGGWRLNGQKVWTSMALEAQWGICLARTDPDAPKHLGITYFIVDMSSSGLDIRPLRELTGAAMFNEVFFDDVFVPDDCVIGEVNGGWSLARQTLANERVSMSSGSTFGIGVESLVRLAGRRAESMTPSLTVRLGHLVAEAHSLRLMTHRATLLALAGTDPGSAASLRKLLGAEHEQRVQELGLSMLGPEGATMEGPAGRWTMGFLTTRCLTIAGGTSEVQRNVIAERLLGLPRDPEPGA